MALGLLALEGPYTLVLVSALTHMNGLFLQVWHLSWVFCVLCLIDGPGFIQESQM